MKKHMNRILPLLAAVIAALSLCACSGGSSIVGAPFFESAEWSWSSETVEEKMGVCAEPYSSIYGGTTFTYPHSYLGREGTVKFMFSESGRLASVAWTFITGSADELDAVCSEAERIETRRNGRSSSPREGVGNSGNVWYTKDADILLYSVSVNGSYGFQYSYINRDFSKRNIAKSR